MYMADKEKKNYSQDYYDMLQNENYKNLLDSEIQLNNARERSLRQTNANLAGYGLASAGYGQTARSGIENQYLSALGSANDAYTNQTEQNIKDATEYADSEYTKFLSDLSNYDMYDEGVRSKTLKEYGFLNADGTINEKAIANAYGDNNLKSFNAMYQQWQEGDGATSEEEDPVDKANREATQEEMDFLTGNDKDDLNGKKFYNNLREGDVVKLSGNEEDVHQKYYKFTNGKLVECSKDDYDKASGKQKYWIRSRKNSKDMIVDWDGKTIYNKSTQNINQNNTNAAIAAAVMGFLGLGPIAGMTGIGSSIGSIANAKDYNDVNKNYNAYMNYYNSLG